MRRTAIGLWMVTLASACGSDGTDASASGRGGFGGSGLVLSHDVRRFVAEMCAKYDSCAAHEGVVTTDEETCGRLFAAIYGCSSALGSLELGDSLEVCLPALRAYDCHEFVNAIALPIAACQEVERRIAAAVGGKDVGASCNPLFDECLPGLACSSGSSEACGMCVKAGAAGQDCVNDGFEGAYGCAPGAFCNESSRCELLHKVGTACAQDSQCMLGACPAGTCVEPAEEGEDCSQTRCATSLFCGKDDKCAPRRAEGKACKEDQQCRLGSACVDGTCQMAAECGTGGARNACLAHEQCFDGFACGANGCGLPVSAAKSCDGTAPCEAGTYCVDFGEGLECSSFECTPP